MMRQVGLDVDGWPVLGRLVDGGIQTADQIAEADADLLSYEPTVPIHTGPRQVATDADGWPVMGRY